MRGLGANFRYVHQNSFRDGDLRRIYLEGTQDLENDANVGFQLITTDDIDDLGIPEVIRRIRRRVGNTPVYLRHV